MSHRAALMGCLSMLLGASAAADTLKFSAYSEDPVDHEPPLTPTSAWQLALIPLEVVACDQRSYLAKLPGKGVAVSIAASPVGLLKRRLDEDKRTVDGKPFVGSDGELTREYIESNSWLAEADYVSALKVTTGGRTHAIPARHFVFMLLPELRSREDFPCAVDAWWAPKQKLAVVSLGGSDGAGSWRTFVFFGPDGFKGQYWNWCSNPMTFCAMTLDPFPRARGKQYVDIELEREASRSRP